MGVTLRMSGITSAVAKVVSDAAKGVVKRVMGEILGETVGHATIFAEAVPVFENGDFPAFC
jgi:hypothetical protein